EVVYPIQVDDIGQTISQSWSPSYVRGIHKRDLSSAHISEHIYYKVVHRRQELLFNLTVNHNLLAPGFISERRHGGLAGAKIWKHDRSSCHFIGDVQNQASQRGRAAISACGGLTGVFQLSGEDFFIEPLEEAESSSEERKPHMIFRRHVTERPDTKATPVNGPCGIRESHRSQAQEERRREKWQQRHQRPRRIRQRSISKEKWVETLVVADRKMVEYHGSENVENYVLTVMNMVASLFHDASIGNSINIVVVRLITLEEDEDDLKITHHADNTLSSFCKWQKDINMKGDRHPIHHDVAILLTRKDICAAMNRPCETLGLSHVAGMCQPHRSCNINEDTGLPVAFTIAHELGHSFGIQHDGTNNDCEPIGKRPFIMSPQLLYGAAPPIWSRCSREYITRFFDYHSVAGLVCSTYNNPLVVYSRGWGLCLDEPPAQDTIELEFVPPGVIYDASHQCRLQYGSDSIFCDDMDWCIDGECLSRSYPPERINGGWASWSQWSPCTRSCGAGVSTAERQCTNPTPKYGGKYCLGERKRYKICNTRPCTSEKPSFRQLQCEYFNNLPYKGKLYKWVPVKNRINPCELHCRPVDEYFSEKMLDAVVDGTRCYEGSISRDMCINGICKNIGCDYEIDSNAVEDRCGVCHGNGSTCETVTKTFEESEGLGYVDVGVIPEGAREIRIEEVAEAGNFLALRSSNPDKYFLNGDWTIQWNGDYKVAGTTFTYERNGNLENLTSPGPTLEPVWIQLLFQETNPGVRYEYTIHREPDSENDLPLQDFSWQYSPWTKCSVTCGTGVQRQIVHCVERTEGIVEEHFCEPETRPDDQQASCNEEPCPARWWVGEWQKCSATCGDSGTTIRTVLCIQSVGLDEQRALQLSECKHLDKPVTVAPCNRDRSCPEWFVGSWTECSVTCGDGVQRRPVSCSNGVEVECDPIQKPPSEMPCSLQRCPKRLKVFVTEWFGSGASSKEHFNEIDLNSKLENHLSRPGHGVSAEQRPEMSGDLSNDIEVNFPLYGRTGPSDHKGSTNVFVDDFYYDYNFINFHEDLSYDPLSEPEEPRADILNNNQSKDPTLVIFEPNIETTVTSVSRVSPSEQTPATDLSQKSKDRDLSGFQEHDRHVQEDLNNLGEKDTDEDDENTFYEENQFLRVVEKEVLVTPASSSSGRVKEAEDTTITKAPLSTKVNLVTQSYMQEHHDFEGGQSLGVQVKMQEGDKTTKNEEVSEEEGRNPHDDDGVKLGTMITEDGDFISYYDLPRKKYAGDVKEGIEVNNLKETTKSERMLLPSEDWATTAYVTKTATANPTWFYLNNMLTTNDDQSSTEMTLYPGSRERTSAFTELPDPSQYNHLEEVLPTSSQASEVTDSPLSSPSHSWVEIDSNEIIIPSVVMRSTEDNHPATTHIPVIQSSEGSLFLDNVQMLVTTPTPQDQPSTSLGFPEVNVTVFWRTGNWSTCSTTCGLGAIWRTVECGTGSDADCDVSKKPAPARRCYLRPCSMWHVGNWSKCSSNCGGGLRTREVHCVDSREQRLLRPFHCQAIEHKPPTSTVCKTEPCLEWYSSSWSECSEVCGHGQQERFVTCPEFGRCNENNQPNITRSCNTHPCTKWVVGSWGQCSATCGGGLQRRLVKCLNTKTGETEEDSDKCSHDSWPENTQKCNTQECNNMEPKPCHRDRLTLGFCQTLKLLGRCKLPTVKEQCCQSCQAPGHGVRERGDERVTRR
ncbi:ATS7 metalloproteinase, partial [Polypterus senegalus]|nr:ATS7 metalloproteinase [Polypterus senegalus]